MRKILIAAFAIAFVSVQAVSRLRTVVNQRAEVAQITSLPMLDDYEFVGCFADNDRDRAIPNLQGKRNTAHDCLQKARKQGHDVFGLQHRGECWTGDINVAFGKYGKGPAHQCNDPRGAVFTNMVYRKVTADWRQAGCYKDDSSRTIPHFLGHVDFWNPRQCQLLAHARGFDTIGLQFHNQCWGGKSPQYQKLGGAQNCANLKGHEWTNLVYVKVEATEYKYRGCWKDQNQPRTIPIFLGKVGSVKACENLAKMSLYSTFGLQNGGECWVGNRPNFRMLGEETDKHKYMCGHPLGGPWANQVYSLYDN